MSAVSGNLFPVGLRYAVAFLLDENGFLAADSATTPYEGVQFVASKTLAMTIPEPRKINHTGDDRVLQVDSLPPQEGASGELQVGRDSMELEALLSNTKVQTVGEAKILGFATDQQGFEPLVGMMVWQQALNESGKRVWRTVFFPSVKAVYTPGGMGDNPEPGVYHLTPYIVQQHLWGAAMTIVDNGYLEAQMEEMMTLGVPKVVAWLGDASATIFTFPVKYPLLTTAKLAIYFDGVLQTTGYVATLLHITFTPAPPTGTNITVVYEANASV